MSSRVHLSHPHSSLVVDFGSSIPRVAHWGAPLVDSDIDTVDTYPPRGALPGSIDEECAIGMVPLHADGWFGRPGLQGHRRGGDHWAPRFTVQSARPLGGGRGGVEVLLVDAVAQLEMRITATADEGGTFSLQASVTNVSRDRFLLDALATTVPVPATATHLCTFHGRWCKEMQRDDIEWTVGAHAAENRRGRTSHEHPPFLIARASDTNAMSGEAWAVHTAWSGNHFVWAENMPDGRRYVQCGELLHGGEICLEPGDTYRTPRMVLAYSADGDRGIARTMQSSVRSSRDPLRPRPVTLNTWEAVYFAHDVDTLSRLARVAAEVGVERFVLDDGWFHGRRNDRAGLGDWVVDKSVYPSGLTPLIDRVHELGMEFGLWVEPEMVNPDSGLYRAHPEWVLEHRGYGHVLGRHQLVLDLTNADAFAHVRDRLDDLLTSHNISYMKWDMNRPHVAASTQRGAAATHLQTLALYRLIDEVRMLHPDVEIESCSSGGGRVDHEILARCERVWASDTNDPVRRQVIQRNMSLFVPPEMMGCHVGPPTAHTTGRESSLAMRAITAIVGHMGVEWNLLDLTDSERGALARAIEVHKHLRSVLHTGTPLGSDVSASDPALVFYGVVSPDFVHAVGTVARLSNASCAHHVRVAGLQGDRTYVVRRVDVTGNDPEPLSRAPEWWNGAHALTGEELSTIGLELPELQPESAVLFTMDAS